MLFIHFFHIRILQTLCVVNHKLNRMHHCFNMKVKKVLNRFFNVYAINVIVSTCMGYFFGILYRAFTLNKNRTKMHV